MFLRLLLCHIWDSELFDIRAALLEEEHEAKDEGQKYAATFINEGITDDFPEILDGTSGANAGRPSPPLPDKVISCSLAFMTMERPHNNNAKQPCARTNTCHTSGFTFSRLR